MGAVNKHLQCKADLKLTLKLYVNKYIRLLFMLVAPIPENESKRLEELRRLEILDTLPEEEYDDLVKLASAICNSPMSLVSLVDSQRQWFKAKVGLDANETHRDFAFCAHAILEEDLTVVTDAVEDQRFHDNPLVLGNPNIRFYAGMPLITKAGYKIGTLCVLDSHPRDLTEDQRFALKTLGRQLMNMLDLRIANKQLAKLNNLQNKFLAIIAHDVRSPLNTVNSLIQMLNDEHITAQDFNEVTSQLGGHVDQTLELVTNLIDWGMAQSKNYTLNIGTAKLKDVIDSEFKKISVTAKEKGIELVNNVSEDALVAADVNMLRFILRNLITNAIKFTDEGSITVTQNETKQGWQINVEDTGVGMSKDAQQKLFNWDTRYTTIGTNDERGSGLGLLMCKEFAEKHSGSIAVESEIGKGSTFSVVLNTKFTLA